jgi:hypothetical protein
MIRGFPYTDPDTEIYPFVRRMTKDLGISAGFTPLIGQAMQVSFLAP